MIDLVYPLKRRKGSKTEDIELRFSLRSVARFLRMPVRNVYVVGHRPRWLTNVVHVEMGDDTGDKALNLQVKYRRMCEIPGLSDPFLLLDDDHIFLRPTSETPLHTKGMLTELCDEYDGRPYGIYLRNALTLLAARGLPRRNYQIHFPLLIDHAHLLDVLDMAGDTPVVMGSLYGNLVDGPTVEVERDFKLNGRVEFDRLMSGHFVSLSVWGMRYDRTKPLLQAALPEASPWEVDVDLWSSPGRRRASSMRNTLLPRAAGMAPDPPMMTTP